MNNKAGMISKSLYFEDVSRIVKKGLENNRKTERNLQEDIKILKRWVKSQPHLPEIPDENVCTSFLMMNKFSIENTKQKIDMYYTMRSLFPEFFENKHPLSPHMLELMDALYYLPLPKPTEEGYRVTVFKIPQEDHKDKAFDISNFFGHTYNIMDVRLREDCILGDIVIYDLKNVKMTQLARATPTMMKKVATIFQRVFNSNIKQLHFLNSPSYAEPVMSLAKQLVKPKIAQRFHFHKDTKTLFDFIPSQILPKDFGGQELSLHELNEIWKNKFTEHKDLFDALEKLRVNERLRPIPLVNDDILGFHGNFKKLDVD